MDNQAEHVSLEVSCWKQFQNRILCYLVTQETHLLKQACRNLKLCQSKKHSNEVREMQRQNLAIEQNAEYHVDSVFRQSQAALSHQTVGFQGAALQFENEAKTVTAAEVASKSSNQMFNPVFTHVSRTQNNVR